MKHYTSISQSKKLLELGLSPETADMHYLFENFITQPIIKIEVGYNKDEEEACLEDNFAPEYIPCWSLGALLELMPHIIEDDNYTNEITPLLYPMQGKWFCVYNELDKDGYSPYAEEKGITPIEAAYSMVVWLLENGFIKKS